MLIRPNILKSALSAPVMLATFVFVLSSCGLSHEDDDENEFMKPGENCLSCHGAGGKAADEARFTLAGTVFPSTTASTEQGLQGVKIEVTDADGKSLTLTSNRVGNFFTSDSLVFPLKSVKVSKDGKEASMGSPASSGGCSGCHNQPSSGGAPGRLYLSLQ